ETALFHKGRNLFGLYEARQSLKSTLPYLLVVEGYMDAVMLAQHGFRNVVATLGTATTRDHLNLMFKSTPRIVFCFDGDRAGRAAAWRALDQALPEIAEGREFRFMFLPDGKDPDELVQEIGADAFGNRVEQAISLADYLLDELKKQANPATLEGRAKFVTLAKPFLGKMREGPLRELITDEVAKLARMSRADFTIPAPKAVAPREPAAPTSQATLTLAKPVRDALRCLLEQPELAGGLADIEIVEDAGASGLEVLLAVARFLSEHGRVSAAQLIELWRDRPEAPIISRLAAEAVEPGQGDPSQILAEAWAHLRLQGQKAPVARLLKASEQRSLSGSETAELQRLTQQLARR